MITVRPEFFQAVFIKKGGRQVGLWIKVGSDNPYPEVGIHPREVVDERGFSDSAFMVKECDDRCTHDHCLMMHSSWSDSRSRRRVSSSRSSIYASYFFPL